MIGENISNAFVYIDPPYVNKGKKLYMNFYKKEDHVNIANSIFANDINFLWMISYDNNDLIKELYGSCENNISWNLGYGASNRKGKEEIFLHPKLKLATSKIKLGSALPS